MTLIKVNDVSKKYKIFKERSSTLKDRLIYKRKNVYEEFVALNSVSLTISKGETVGLIGKNGSGKSTLLKLLTRIIFPDSGTVRVEGKVSSLLELGAGFHPDFTGRENIYMNASLLGLSKKEITSKLDDIIRFSELGHYIENPVRSYSSGMYMRLAFSVAIMVEPDILLVDEVLAVGDTSFQQKCLNQLNKMKSNGTTIVIVSHDLDAMEKLCSRVVWINEGKVMLEGSPKNTINEYLMYLSAQENGRLINESIIADSNSDLENSSLKADEINSKDRCGSKEIEIIDVKFIDANNIQKMSFLSSDYLKVSIKIKANSFVENPIFGFAIHNQYDVHCYGTNTYIDDIPIGKLNSGDIGTIELSIPSLDLVAGTYYFSVAAHDQFDNQYDNHNKSYRINVSSTVSDVGVVKLKHEWKKNIRGEQNEI